MNHVIGELTPFLSSYGLWVVFFGMMIEGTTMILATGVLCFLGLLDIRYAWFVAYAGALIGDQLWYLLGRDFLTLLFGKIPSLQQKIKHLEERVKQKGKLLSFSGRFIYGGAILFPLSLGFYRYPYRTFLLFDALGVFLWSGLGIVLGYALGTSAQTFMGEFEKIWHIVVVILLAVSLILFAKKYYCMKKQ